MRGILIRLPQVEGRRRLPPLLLGDDPWWRIKDKAGEAMGAFTDQCVERPIREISEGHMYLSPSVFPATTPRPVSESATDELYIERRLETVVELVGEKDEEREE